MKNKFKKYYIFHHVIILKRFVIRLIRYLHNIKLFYICKTSFRYCLIKPLKEPHKETHKETHKKPGPMKSGLKGHYMTALKITHKKTHKIRHKKPLKKAFKNMT